MDSETVVANQIRVQFEATLGMLRDAVTRCPDSLWEAPDSQPAYWHEAYHAMFWCDNFVGDKDKRFEFRPLGVDIDPRLFRIPKTRLSQPEFLRLLDLAKTHIAQRLGRMTDADFKQEDGFGEGESREFDIVLHRILYGLRHGQHHVGKLASMLSARGIHLGDWQG